MHDLKTAEKNRQQVIAELREKFELVEAAIAHLSTSKKCIEGNAAEVKAKILQDITEVLNTLRGREVQLLRQIDVMEAHHLNLLHTQYAELHQLLGNLRHTLYCAERQQDIPAHNISASDMELVQMVLKQKVVPGVISYWSDTRDLDAIIQNFGAVATNLMTLQGTGDLVSKCLPSKMEEYGDCEQQLLYKTLEEIKAKKEAGLQASLKFPKLSDKTEDWLRESTPVLQSAQIKAEFCFPDCFLSKDVNRWLKQDSTCIKALTQVHNSKEKKVEDWLRQIKQKDASNSAEICKNGEISRSERQSQTSESIEIFSHPESDCIAAQRTASFSSSTDSNGFCCFSKQAPATLPTNTKQNETWLNCCQGEIFSIDIENLHTISCTAGEASHSDEGNKWLFKQVSSKKTKPSFEEHWSSVCRANEPCSDFSECVCKEECTNRAIEWQAMWTKEIDKNSPFRSGTEEPMWLRRISSEVVCKKWIESLTEATSQEKLDFSEKGDEAWNKTDDDSKAALKEKSCWLMANNLETDAVDNESCMIRTDFKSYFLPGNIDTWLATSKA